MTRLLILFLFVGHFCHATEYFVSTGGSDNHDGLSETSSWRTIAYAAKRVKAGDTVWIKAGNYGSEYVVVENSGNQSNPISFIGYKQRKGDIESLYYNYAKDKPFDENELPLLDGGNRASGLKGISIDKKSYVILKNLQIKNYRWGIHGGTASFCVIDGILASSFGDLNTKVSGYGAQFGNGGNNLIKNSTFINATGANLRIEGDRNIIDNVKSYADDNSTEEISSTDYYIHINGGNNNIIRNSHVERVGNLHHTGHGFGLKYDCQNNLIENCTSVNVKGAVELRHSGVKNNLVRNVLITGPQGTITLRDGASGNIIENCEVYDSNEGIRFYDQTEDGQGGLIASDNIIRNSVFSNLANFIVATKSSKVSQIGYVSRNKVINCTVVDVRNLYRGDLPMDETNEVINCIFSKVGVYESKQSKYVSKWQNFNNNFHQVDFEPITGNGNMSGDPGFQDASKRDYRLKSSSKMIDAGRITEEVKKDKDGKNRPQGNSHDLGAFEYNDTSTGSVDEIEADAGQDVTICSGEQVSLVATGGKSYLWSTGEDSKSISVAPTETTTYTVTAIDGDLKDQDKVTVFVNSVSADAGADQTILEGESIKLTARGGDEYLWSNGKTGPTITVSPSATKTYEVTVYKNGCSDSDEVRITVNSQESDPPPVVNASAGEDKTICLGENVELRGNGGQSYLWSTGESNRSITVSPIRTTTYELTVAENGVSDVDFVTVFVENCEEPESSLPERSSFAEDLIVYPNPTSDYVNVEASNFVNEASLDLINMNGQIMFTDQIESNGSKFSKQIDLTSFEKGVYFVRLYSQDQYLVKKIVMI